MRTEGLEEHLPGGDALPADPAHLVERQLMVWAAEGVAALGAVAHRRLVHHRLDEHLWMGQSGGGWCRDQYMSKVSK